VKSLNKKKILITAGNSKIGNDLVNYFIRKNCIVYETYKKNKNLLNNKNLKHIKFNFSENFKLKKNFDLFIHCASLTPYKFKMSKRMIDLNVSGLSKILRSGSKFKNIVLFSTMSVYGKISSKILNENSNKKQLNDYGRSKLIMENLLKNYCKINKVNYLILRLPGVIGNFISNNNFLNNIMKNLSENKGVVYKNPESYFNNVIHTYTIAKISNDLMALKKKNFSNKIFNMCSTHPVQLKKLIKILKNKLNSKSKLKISKSNHSFQISSKKCLKYDLKIVTTIESVNKTIKYLKSI